jgi:hypothetical protein
MGASREDVRRSGRDRRVMLEQSELSPTALRCLDLQLAEALDLAVWCHRLSDPARCDGQDVTVVVLERLASDFTDLAAFLIPLVGIENRPSTPPLPDSPSSGAGGWLAELDNRIGQAGLLAEVDALSPGLESGVVRLLYKLAALYQSCRELLLASTARDRA